MLVPHVTWQMMRALRALCRGKVGPWPSPTFTTVHSGRRKLQSYQNIHSPGSNMEVENGPLEDPFPLQTGGFPLPC